MRKIVSIAIATLLASTLASAADEIYRWKDANGVHYSDQPHPGAELIKSHGQATPGPIAADVPPPASSTSTAPTPLPVSDDVAKQVRQEAASIKADQCKKAEDNYQKSMQARRIYKTDEKGNRVYLNEAEMDATRLQARSDRDVACGPGR